MIRLIKPYIAFSEVESDFRNIFESGIFTKGSYVKSFSKALCDYTGSSFCNFTTSATTALSMCLKLLNIKSGDEVLLSDFSFPATANVIEDLYAHPVFVDVDPDTFNMRTDDLEEKITKNTRAVIFVDALGNPSGIHDIKSICQKYGIPMIEDAACSLGSSENNIKCGNIADLTCFSFHPRKLLTTGEGGAILTNNREYKDILDIKLEHGAVINNNKFDFVDVGYNYRLSELQAAIGLVQLKKLDCIVKSRQDSKEQYMHNLMDLGLIPQTIRDNVVHNTQSVVFKVPILEGRDTRDDLIKYLKQQEIETTIGTYSLSNCTYFRKKYNNVQPVSRFLFDNTITLPCYEDVNTNAVSDSIKSFFKYSEKSK